MRDWRALICEGMLVRTPDGDRLGRVVGIEGDGLVVRHGLVFHTTYLASLGGILDVCDDVVVCPEAALERVAATPEAAQNPDAA